MATEEHHGIPRLMWESEHEWRMRKLFIDANENVYQGDRLGALSMSWANWKFMGCSYGHQVQAILEECHNRCPQEVDDEISRIREMAMPSKVKFVKPAESLGTRIGPPSSGKAGGKRESYFQSPDDVTSKKQKVDNNIQIPNTPNFTQDNVLSNNQLVPGFILYLPPKDDIEVHQNTSPITLLYNSAQKCNSNLEFIELQPIMKNKQPIYRTTCVINHINITTGEGISKKESKFTTAQKSLEILKNSQSVIYKEKVTHDHLDTVNKGSLLKNAFQYADKISDTNVGNKLLRKMGWSGMGGVGKGGSGISEPVFVEAADGRKGVGHVDDNQSIHKTTVDDMLKAFLANSQQDSMKFTSDLSSTDRALIHKLCEKYHLKHKSYGKGEGRYLVVSRK